MAHHDDEARRLAHSRTFAQMMSVRPRAEVAEIYDRVLTYKLGTR